MRNAAFPHFRLGKAVQGAWEMNHERNAQPSFEAKEGQAIAERSLSELSIKRRKRYTKNIFKVLINHRRAAVIRNRGYWLEDGVALQSITVGGGTCAGNGLKYVPSAVKINYYIMQEQSTDLEQASSSRAPKLF